MGWKQGRTFAAMVAVAASLGGVVPATASAAGDLVVAVDDAGRVTRLGPLRPVRGESFAESTYAATVRAFGRPGALRRGPRYFCAARWFRHGLRIEFVDYSGAAACVDGGFIQAVSVSSRRWRTADGLRVGDTLSDLRFVYPDATRHGRAWWLVEAYSQIGDGGSYGALSATVSGGRVKALHAYVGAGGD